MKFYIYFLIDRKKIVYIGQTQRFEFRLAAHGDKVFNNVRRIECSKEKLSFYEARWIAKFKPKYNKNTSTNFNRNKITKVDWTTVSIRFRDKSLLPLIKSKAKQDNRPIDNFIEFTLSESLK